MKQKTAISLSILVLILAKGSFALAQSALFAPERPIESEIVELDGQKVKLRKDQIVEMQISGAESPVPALEYKLFPSSTSLKKGDGATFYHRALFRLQQLRRNKNPRKNQERRAKGEIVPIADQTFGELTDYLDKKLTPEQFQQLKKVVDAEDGHLFQELLTATYLRECDWGFDVVVGRPLVEYIGFLLPEMQEIRGIARYLAVKAKVEIAEKDFEGAIETIRTGFKMAKVTEKTQFLVCSLIGIATSSIMFDQLQDLIGTEGSPNLYWAIETLPDPLVSVKPAFVFELEYIRSGAGLWFLDEPEKRKMSAEQWSEAFNKDMQNLIKTFGLVNDQNQVQSQFGLLALRAYPIAKRELVEWGFDQNEVEKMPVAQVIAIHQSRVQKIIADEILKYQNMDYKIIKEKLKNIDQRLLSPLGKSGKFPQAKYRELIPVASMLIPAITAVLEAEVRLKRKKGLFQTVEAIRMHIAETGRMPESLDEIKIVPVPNSPDSDQPFRYRKIEGGYELWEMKPDGSGVFSSSKVLRLKLRK